MKFIKRLFIFSLICMILGVSAIFGMYLYVKKDLPNVDELRHVELETPMQVFSSDGKLIAQFGEKKRIPVKYEDIPQDLIDALIATEDSRFYSIMVSTQSVLHVLRLLSPCLVAPNKVQVPSPSSSQETSSYQTKRKSCVRFARSS